MALTQVLPITSNRDIVSFPPQIEGYGIQLKGQLFSVRLTVLQ